MTVTTDKTKVSSYMDQDVVRKLRVLAAVEGQSISSYLEFLAKREIQWAESKGLKFELESNGSSKSSRVASEVIP